MASGDTGNVVPGNRLRVRAPCPPLLLGNLQQVNGLRCANLGTTRLRQRLSPVMVEQNCQLTKQSALAIRPRYRFLDRNNGFFHQESIPRESNGPNGESKNPIRALARRPQPSSKICSGGKLSKFFSP